MSKVYLAIQDNVETEVRLASGSMTILKRRMKGEVDATGKKLKKPIDRLGTTWTVVLYDVKPNVPNLCQMIEDVTEFEAEWVKTFAINASGQIRDTTD